MVYAASAIDHTVVKTVNMETANPTMQSMVILCIQTTRRALARGLTNRW
jgi:hypothetical protein